MNKLILGAAGACALAAFGYVGLLGGEPQSEARVAPVVSAQAPAIPKLPVPGGMPFPVDIDVAFNLTDHFGKRVTERTYRGRPMLLFFGYANCESICTVALPRMGQALAMMGDEGAAISALMVTVDPEHDTPDAMRRGLARWHERLVGLTGTEKALADLRQRFQVNLEQVAEDPTGAPIYAHGGFIYFIGADGEVKTMIPPILGPDRIAELARKYFLAAG